jgi:hypothetical protein
MKKKIAAVLFGSGLAVIATLAVGSIPTPAIAASDQSEAALLVLEEDFEVFPVEDGWLLQPLDDSLGIRTIEVKGNSLAIDGQRISGDELHARIGGLAQSVLDLGVAASVGVDDRESADLEESEAEREEARAERSERARRRHSGHRDRSDSQVVVGNDLTVEEDDVYRDIVVFGGHLTVDGQVIGDAVAIGGAADVSGEITGDLAVIGGSVELQEGARIMGDVVSVGGSVEQGENVEVAGQVIEVPFGPNLNFGNFRGSWGNWGSGWDFSDEAHKWGRHARWFGFFDAGWELISVLFCALLACLVFLVARNPVERIATKVSDEPWKSGLVGLLTQILCVPVLVLVCLVLLISIIGIPLLLLVPFAILGFVLVAFLGYTAVAYWLGGWSENRFGWNFQNPYFSLLLGVGLIEALALVGEFLGLGPGPIKFFAAMFVLFGCLVAYVAWTVGLGGAVLTRFGTWGNLGGSTSPPPPPTEPLPPAPDWDEPPVSNEAIEPGEYPEAESDTQSEHL